jgi:hypothetical protein
MGVLDVVVQVLGSFGLDRVLVIGASGGACEQGGGARERRTSLERDRARNPAGAATHEPVASSSACTGSGMDDRLLTIPSMAIAVLICKRLSKLIGSMRMDATNRPAPPPMIRCTVSTQTRRLK